MGVFLYIIGEGWRMFGGDGGWGGEGVVWLFFFFGYFSSATTLKLLFHIFILLYIYIYISLCIEPHIQYITKRSYHVSTEESKIYLYIYYVYDHYKLSEDKKNKIKNKRLPTTHATSL